MKQNQTATQDSGSLDALVRHDPPFRFITLDYGMMIDTLRDVSHLSDSQLSQLGEIIAHRLRYRSTHALAKMIEGASRELRQALEDAPNGEVRHSAGKTGCDQKEKDQ